MANKNTRKRDTDKPRAEMTPEQKKQLKAERKAETQEIKERNKKQSGNRKKEKRDWKEYFRGIKTEIKKVVWPTKQELGQYTLVVICTCAFFALLFWAVDTGFLAVLKGLLGISM
jgi:preprotein translocase subunit SecE